MHAVDDASPAGYLIEVEYVLARSPARRARCGALRLRRFRERPRPADWPSPGEAASGVRCGGGRGRCRASDAGVVCLRCGALCPGVCQHRSGARDRHDGLRCAVAHRPRQSSRTRVERAPVSPRQVKGRGALVNVLRVSCGDAETPRHAHMRGQVALESHVLSVEPHQRQRRSGWGRKPKPSPGPMMRLSPSKSRAAQPTGRSQQHMYIVILVLLGWAAHALWDEVSCRHMTTSAKTAAGRLRSAYPLPPIRRA